MLNQLVPLRPALSVGELADMQEDALAAAVGRDEAEAFVVVPGGDSSLMAHGGGGWVRGGEGESTTSVVSGAEDKPGGDGPSAWGGAPCLCRAGYGFLPVAYDGSSASSCIRFCSAACGGDDRLPEFPIHPTDPEQP